MANKFAVVGVSGIVICVACLAAAAAIGGNELRDFDFDFDNLSLPRCNFDDANKSASRTVAWTGDRVKIGLSANVHYRPGSGDQMQVTGNSGVISHVQVHDGEIRFDCRGRYRGERVEITLPGRAFEQFNMGGSGSLTLDDLDQPDLRINLGGANHVTATGKAGNLDLKMGGANHADLGALVVKDAKVSMGGSNEVDVSATDDLTINIGGSGTVRLHTEPRHLDTHIGGSGRIIHAAESNLDKNL
jgi:hypothetical protein